MTPLYKALKSNGTSFYAFPGAAEDISAAYQNSNYKMYFSKFTLLNFPIQNLDSGSPGSVNPNWLDFVNSAGGGSGFITPQGYSAPNTFAEQLIESLRNYVANHEVTMKESRMNSSEYYYDNTVLSTPTEKIFWKWCRKLNLISLEPANNGDEFFGNLVEFNSRSTTNDYFPEQLWRERETVDYSVLTLRVTTQAVTYGNVLEIELQLAENPFFMVGDVVELSGITDASITSFNGQKARIKAIVPKSVAGVKLITDLTWSVGPKNGNITTDISLVTIVYHRLVQYIGEVNGVNNVQQANRSYTEVYAHVPDQAGMTPDILFRTQYDRNYKPQMTFPILPSQYQPEINGAEIFSNPIVSNPNSYPGGYFGQFDTADFTYTTSDGDSNRRSGDYFGIGGTRDNPTYDARRIDGLNLDFDPAHYVKMNIAGRKIANFDSFNALDVNGEPPKDFEFNAILWYYTVEDSKGNKTSNLYGISFVDNPANNPIPTEVDKRIAAFRKLAATDIQDGVSYAFSLNLNFNIINENPQDTYNPEAINSLFSFNLFNEAMRRVGELNDSFLRILTTQNKVQTDVSNLTQLLYTQTDFQTINTRIDNLENLLKLYSTNQIDSTDSIFVSRDDSQRPPKINLKNIDPNYDVIYNYKSSALYSTSGAIPTFVTVPTNKNFLINIQNDDVNAFTLPNNDKLTIVLDRDLAYKQTVDIVIDGTANSTQNKQLDVFVNFIFGNSSNPVETQLIETVDLPIYFNQVLNGLNVAATREKVPFDIDTFAPVRLTTGNILEVKVNGASQCVYNAIEKGDTVILNDFTIGTASRINFSGQYKLNSVGVTNSILFFDISNNTSFVSWSSSKTLPYVFNDPSNYILSSVPYLKLNKGIKYRITRIDPSNDTQLADRYFVEKYDLGS